MQASTDAAAQVVQRIEKIIRRAEKRVADLPVETPKPASSRGDVPGPGHSASVIDAASSSSSSAALPSASSSATGASSPASPLHTREILVPSCAMGLLIGEAGATIRVMKETVGILSIRTRPVCANPNSDVSWTIEARTASALRQVVEIITPRVSSAERGLSNGSRQLHSNMPRVGRPDSMVHSPAFVHKLPKKNRSDKNRHPNFEREREKKQEIKWARERAMQ
jgi:hypothetical protein